MNRSTKERIYALLQPEGLAWGGGLTSFAIAEELKLPVQTVRKHLRTLRREGRAYCCAVPKGFRDDGRTANTLLWFRGGKKDA